MSWVTITSSGQLKSLVQQKPFVVVCFYDESNRSSVTLLDQLKRLTAATGPLESGNTAFASVDVSEQGDVASEYGITQEPVVLYFKAGKIEENTTTPVRLEAIYQKILDNAAAGPSKGSTSDASGSDTWRGAGLPRGYSDITSQIELQRCELLNVDSDGGGVRILFDKSKPSALSGAKAASGARDWVESDTDEQLLLFLPFQAMLRLHTIQITSLPPQGDDDESDDDEAPMRPRTIKLFSNKPHNLGFDEAEDMAATQTIELTEKDWNADGTASIPLRYVKFQNITSLVMFIVNGDGESEKVRLDRIRLIGEAGEKREMGKLEKIGDQPGE
ncbi:PITH domain-containing protein [Echria macrotheca]|uniref:PITH domain-containing protein n=1 Tax=Echria macrotheca TaxID=438768 RepID=A0AAJ0B098_9PEZI|nr:PITH domain-containing protein [Echria macrotheca]